MNPIEWISISWAARYLSLAAIRLYTVSFLRVILHSSTPRAPNKFIPITLTIYQSSDKRCKFRSFIQLCLRDLYWCIQIKVKIWRKTDFTEAWLFSIQGSMKTLFNEILLILNFYNQLSPSPNYGVNITCKIKTWKSVKLVIPREPGMCKYLYIVLLNRKSCLFKRISK